jgi:predicted oxidoreductase (fatty acid repression mutant protein)
MGKFHRYDISKPKKKRGGVNNKKRIRDIERLLAKTEGKMPEDIKTEKLKELKELKKGEKSKKEAEKFESRYKKIKFFEKKKIIRRLEKIDKQIKDGGEEAALE